MNATETPPLTEGQRLAGCYTLKRSLETQDDSAVWLGQDEVLGKEVTLHFVPLSILKDQRAVAELRQEVKRNRQLIHPNILRVYDYVEDAGHTAISMDKFDAQRLSALLKAKKAFEAPDIQPWIAQLAETLSDAHRIQLIHRDLAPENILIKSSGGILLSHFGISRVMHDALERAGKVKGAATHLAYVSPQQIDGDRAVPADDVYGLGALMFELLTGRQPFVGDNLVPQIRKTPVPSINTVRAEIGKAPVPAPWQQVVESCLAKTPEQRPRSCGEVIALLSGSKAVPTVSNQTSPSPSRADAREQHAASSRSAAAEPPAKTAVESTPSKDGPASSSSAKLNLSPAPTTGNPPANAGAAAMAAAAATATGAAATHSNPATAPASAPISAAAPKKPAPGLSANYPDLDRPKSKTPVVLVGIAALALGAGVLLRNLPEEHPQTAPADSNSTSSDSMTPGGNPDANARLSSGSTEATNPPSGVAAAGVTPDHVQPAPEEKTAPPSAPAAPVTPEPEPSKAVASAPTPSAPAPIAPPTPAPTAPEEPVKAAASPVPPPTSTDSTPAVTPPTPPKPPEKHPAASSEPNHEKPVASAAPEEKTAPAPTAPTVGTDGLIAANKPKEALIGADPAKSTDAPKPTPAEVKPVEKKPPTPAPVTPPTPAPVTPAAPAEAVKIPPAPEVKVIPLPSAPAALPKLVIPTNATMAQLEEILAERQAAADKLAATEKAAEAATKENQKFKDARQADSEQFKKTYDEKRKSLAGVINTGASVETDTAKLKDGLEKAKAAALEAVKAAETAERNYSEFIGKSGEKLAAKAKAEGELRDLVFRAGDQSKGIDELNAQLTKGESLRQQLALSQRQIEQDKAAINTQLAKVRAAELETLRKVNKEKVAAVEAQIKPLEAEAAKYKNALGQLKDLGVAGSEASKPIQQQLDNVNAKISAMKEEIKALNTLPAPGKTTKPSAAVPTPAPAPAPAPAVPPARITNETPVKAALSVGSTPTAPTVTPSPTAPAAPTLPAATVARTTPPPTPAPAPANGTPINTPENPAPAAPTSTGLNSIGMKFALVGNVQFAVYPTTREQFAAFAKATNLKNNSWDNPWFQQGPDHPVVNVTWREAEAFCKWLTDKERKSGLLKAGEQYRLPTDYEWSRALGLPEESGSTPEERDMGVQNVYPWGSQWPPPAGAGNFAGEETKGENPIPGYNDGFENTSPVGKFKPTATGLYDMSGNVWQWVADDWNADKRNKTLRGGSWYNGAIQLSLLSSCRIGSSPDNQNDTYGFRIVKAADAKKR